MKVYATPRLRPKRGQITDAIANQYISADYDQSLWGRQIGFVDFSR
jgi:hypothetical protein